MAYTGLTAHVRAISGTLVDIQPDWLTYTIVLTVPQSSVRLIRHNLSPAYSL